MLDMEPGTQIKLLDSPSAGPKSGLDDATLAELKLLQSLTSSLGTEKLHVSKLEKDGLKPLSAQSSYRRRSVPDGTPHDVAGAGSACHLGANRRAWHQNSLMHSSCGSRFSENDRSFSGGVFPEQNQRCLTQLQVQPSNQDETPGTLDSHLMFALKTAIRDASQDAGRQLDADYHQLSSSDYSGCRKVTACVENMVYSCKVYAPEAFKHMRTKIWRVDDSSFIRSISQGFKVGQNTTKDGLYVIKKITQREAKRLVKILEKYVEYMQESPDTLLCRYYALCRIKPNKCYVVVMSNMLATSRTIHERYDLKGSRIGRLATEEEKSKANPVLKDIDLLMSHKSFAVGRQMKKDLIEQLRQDTTFLESLNLMGYSLCVGIHKRNASSVPAEPRPESAYHFHDAVPAFEGSNFLQKFFPTHASSGDSLNESWTAGSGRFHNSGGSDDFPKRKNLFQASLKNLNVHASPFKAYDGGLSSLSMLNGFPVTGEQIYFFGIINFLQVYDWRKRIEGTVTRLFKPRMDISCVDPRYYAERFIRHARFVME